MNCRVLLIGLFLHLLTAVAGTSRLPTDGRFQISATVDSESDPLPIVPAIQSTKSLRDGPHAREGR